MDFSKWQSYLFNFLFGALGGALVLVIKSYLTPVEPPTQFAVVDTNKIVEMQFLNTLTKAAQAKDNSNSSYDLEASAKAFTDQLLATANAVSKANNLILLTPQASLTELPDLTEQFLQQLGLQGGGNAH